MKKALTLKLYEVTKWLSNHVFMKINDPLRSFGMTNRVTLSGTNPSKYYYKI